ncbi:hypothetical protein HJC23_001632 [Cyclotella cryptica]|uniref:RING-type domain-containing protein n=1 Tax=Cyclotella cryptica TaxID=29204 RepID=A0ABD3QKK9_9STRA
MSQNDSSSNTPKQAHDIKENDACEEECVICLEELSRTDDGWGRCTPCNHAFHKKCWWNWENAHHERVERARRQGNVTDTDGGPKCCLCNTLVAQFVDGTGEPAHNPEPFVASDDGEDRKSFFDWFFRRRRGANGSSRRSSGGQNEERDEDAATHAREFLERMAQQGGSVMGMDPSVLLDQLRFGGGDWGGNSSTSRGGNSSGTNGNGLGFDFGNLFDQWGPGGAGPFGAGAPSDNNDSHEGAFNEIRPGTPVVVQNLVNSPETNGKRGKVHQFQQQTGRYLVKLDSNNVTVSLKGENILQIITVKILGLVSQPQFNGREGTICSYNQERNRYVVRVAYPSSESKEISIKASNIRIPDLSKVRLEGLERQPQWNGRYGTIMKWEDGRYHVRLSNMYSVRVKVENVRL